MSLQSFDATYRDWRMKKQGACKCVCMSSSTLNIFMYIFSCESLSVVGQRINMTHAEVFPGSQVLHDSVGWVIVPSTRKGSISLPVLPLCLWEWCEALSRVWETRSLKQRTEHHIKITVYNLFFNKGFYCHWSWYTANNMSNHQLGEKLSDEKYWQLFDFVSRTASH